jgi:Amt family ammonium transporter
VSVTYQLTWWAIGFGLAYGDTEQGIDEGGFALHGTSHFFVGCDSYPTEAAFSLTKAASERSEVSRKAQDLSYVIFQWGFASTAGTIVSGAVTERIKVEAFGVCTFFVVGIIYPLIAHAVWHTDGWAHLKSSEYGVIDFAGGGAVHMTGSWVCRVSSSLRRSSPPCVIGGLVAFIGAAVVGPRSGRFNEEGRPAFMAKQSTMLQTLGTLLLWFGWYAINRIHFRPPHRFLTRISRIGFNGCSTITIDDPASGLIAGRAVLNTLLGGAAGGIGTLLTLYTLGWGVDIGHVNNGILAGLVSITAGCATLHAWGAVIVALLAGPLYLASSLLLVKLRVDDVLDATAVHFFCGAWGVLCCGIFPSPRSVHFVYQVTSCGIMYSDQQCNSGRQFANQLLYIVAIVLWVGSSASALFLGMKYVPGLLRESFDNEVRGNVQL